MSSGRKSVRRLFKIVGHRQKEELKREFEKGNQDRELAVHELSNRRRFRDESAQTFAFKSKRYDDSTTKHAKQVLKTIL